MEKIYEEDTPNRQLPKEEFMKKYTEMNHEELLALKKELDKEFEEIKAQGLALDMSRGKPSNAQLELSMEMMDVLKGNSDLKCETGVDCRNYGVIDGIPEAKRLLGEMSEVDPEHIIIYGNSSLNVMFDSIARSMTQGVMGNTPWCKLDKVKFLCPVPGYDRHFKITEFFGIEMINVPMTPQGPDMDMVEKLVSEDAAIKGIWCVPLHSNPQGVCYSDKTVDTLASMTTAADDFRIFWDNAYGVHHIYEEVPLKNILKACEKAGYPNRCYYFFSTSKITFPGAGVSLIASSPDNVKELLGHMSAQTISHDKLNQLRHVQFFGTSENIHNHMTKLAALLKPKFDIVLQKLQDGLGASPPVASWSHPKGGYFVSLNVFPGCAKRTVALAKEAGVTLTGAGASYPYGKDPKDSNIRIAPSYPSVGELSQAMDILILCVKLAYIENKLGIQPK